MAENNQTVPRIIRGKKLLTEDNKIIYLTWPPQELFRILIPLHFKEIFHFFRTYFFDDFWGESFGESIIYIYKEKNYIRKKDCIEICENIWNNYSILHSRPQCVINTSQLVYSYSGSFPVMTTYPCFYIQKRTIIK